MNDKVMMQIVLQLLKGAKMLLDLNSYEWSSDKIEEVIDCLQSDLDDLILCEHDDNTAR
jgi:hypothetical protein